jgi:hypothetical protein
VNLSQMSLTDDWSPVDECCERLCRAGWSMSDALVDTAHGPAWIVTGTDGSSTLRAIGHTQTEAWLHAWEQADAAGTPTV